MQTGSSSIETRGASSVIAITASARGRGVWSWEAAISSAGVTMPAEADVAEVFVFVMTGETRGATFPLSGFDIRK